LKKIISNLSYFFYEYQDKIKDFEINPLILNNRGIFAVDCRIFMK
jgi:succinyl-CoA synthetase beta subunit